MNIHFGLVDKSRTTTSIRVIVTHHAKTYRRATGLSCRTASWSQAKEKTGNIDIDSALKKIRIKLESALNEFSTEEQINAALDAAVAGEDIDFTRKKKSNAPTFMEYFKEWANRDSTSIRQRKLAYNNVEKLMGAVNWGEVNDSYCYRLTRLMEDKDWGINYQGNMIKAIKVVMSEGAKLGYHHNYAYKEFKVPHAEVDNVYLTKDEMERIWEYEPTRGMERRAKDLAWLGYLTLARFSDYSRLSEDNIGTDGKIRFNQTKTSSPVVIPCSPRVREILARNGGKAPDLSHQKFNQEIKNICKAVGICDLVETVRIEGAKRVRISKAKWEMVTSHTFRRSAATNLYLQGVALRSIMQLTGHSSVAMLERYLKVGGEENADKLSGNEFFR